MHKREQWLAQAAPKAGDLCITLHQPWASLLVHGIKRVEGRSWPAPLHVLSERIWIHAAAKVPDASTIEAMETFYREVYRVDGVTDITFPKHYPVSVLLGSVKVVGCLKLEELVSWEVLPQGVRLEGQTEFCWLCEEPQKLVVPFEMRGWLKVYNLEKRIAASATRGLRPICGPAPVKFPLPDLSDPCSLKPGSVQALLNQGEGKGAKLISSPALDASIDNARAAANQFKKKESFESMARVPSESNGKGGLLESPAQVKKGGTSSPRVTQTWVRKSPP